MFNALDKIVTQDDLANFMAWIARSNRIEMESVAFTCITRNSKLSVLGFRNEKVKAWMRDNADLISQ